MNKSELINLKNELYQQNYKAHNNEKSIGLENKRILNPEKEEKTKEFVASFESALVSIVSNCARMGYSLDELEAQFDLFFLTTKDKEQDFEDIILNKTYKNEKELYNYLKENTSSKYFLCDASFWGNKFFENIYSTDYYVVVEEFIDIDKFIILMRNLGYDLTIDGKEINSSDDIIRYAAKNNEWSVSLNTSIKFTKEKDNKTK